MQKKIFKKSSDSKYSNEGSHRKSKPRPRIKRVTHPAVSDDKVRLNKYLANAGICSRREADEFIKNGLVTINNVIVTELGTKVNPGDIVHYSGEKVSTERKVYIVMNKPKDFITTMEDPNAKKTVMHLIQGKVRERVYPVGRLDRNTTGVLLLTNDGDLTTNLTHPKYEKRKIYHVGLDKSLTKADLIKISEGIDLEDGRVTVDAINYTDDNDKKSIGVEIHSGKNRIVRRIFEQLEYKVVKLDRVYFAGITKKNLKRGAWRFLTDQEINMLKMNAYK